MDVAVTIAEYKEVMKARAYAEKTISLYSRFLSFFAEYLTKNKITDIKQVNRQMVLEYQAMVMNKKCSPDTKALYLRPVKRLFEHLVENHHLLINPTEGIVETHRKYRKVGITLTVSEMQQLLAQPNLSLPMQIRDRAIMEVFYSTAIRCDELVNLEIYNIDLVEKVVHIRKGKGGRQRVVPLGKNAAQYLKEYLEKIRTKYARKNKKERRLFLTNEGKPMTNGSIQAFLRQYRKSARIKKPVSPHTFRRSCATHLLQNGADIRYVQKLLGHKYLKTTQAYTKVVRADIKKTHNQTHPGVPDNGGKEE